MVHQPGVQLHMVTVLQVERLPLSWRLTGLLDSVLQPDLEDLVVVAVAVDGDSLTLAAISLTQGASLALISSIIGQLFIWNIKCK